MDPDTDTAGRWRGRLQLLRAARRRRAQCGRGAGGTGQRGRRLYRLGRRRPPGAGLDGNRHGQLYRRGGDHARRRPQSQSAGRRQQCRAGSGDHRAARLDGATGRHAGGRRGLARQPGRHRLRPHRGGRRIDCRHRRRSGRTDQRRQHQLRRDRQGPHADRLRGGRRRGARGGLLDRRQARRPALRRDHRQPGRRHRHGHAGRVGVAAAERDLHGAHQGGRYRHPIQRHHRRGRHRCQCDRRAGRVDQRQRAGRLHRAGRRRDPLRGQPRR